MIATALLGMLVLLAVQVQVNLIGGQEIADNRYALNTIHSHIRQLLSHTRACEQTFQGKIVTTNVGTFLSIPDIKDKTGAVAYAIDTLYEYNKVEISKIDLSPFVPSSSDPYDGRADLYFHFKPSQNFNAIPMKPRKVPLRIQIDLNGNNSIISCSTISSNRGGHSWKINNNNVYFDGDYVGIGTDEPRSILDVLGDTKIAGKLEAEELYNIKKMQIGYLDDCTNGAQRYNITSKVMEFCNGSVWVSMGGLWSQASNGSVYYNGGKNIGIGIVTPGEKFHLYGKANFIGYMQIDNPSSQALALQGKIAIGKSWDSASRTLAPGDQLGVEGDVLIDGTLETKILNMKKGTQECNTTNSGISKFSGPSQFHYCDGRNWQLLLPKDDRSVVNEVEKERLEVDQVVVGTNHTCALFSSGKAKCWGKNNFGQLGNGTTNDSNIPTYVLNSLDSQPLESILQIDTSHETTCVLLSDGSVKCWGHGRRGQLGNGHFSEFERWPQTVRTIVSATQISVAYESACARLNNGEAKCWGLNDKAQLGNGETTNSSTPVFVSVSPGMNRPDIVSIYVGRYQTCITFSTGGEKEFGCWGWRGQAGIGDDGAQIGNKIWAPKDAVESILRDVEFAAVGEKHICVKLEDTSSRCWGKNDKGQLGDNSTLAKTKPTLVYGLINVAKIAVHNEFSCAVLIDQSVFCWGNIPSAIEINTPARIVNFEIAKDISLGKYHNCIVKENKTILCWLHDLSTDPSNEPIVVAEGVDDYFSNQNELLTTFDYTPDSPSQGYKPCKGKIISSANSSALNNKTSCMMGVGFHNESKTGVCTQNETCRIEVIGLDRKRVCEWGRGICIYSCSNGTWIKTTNVCEKEILEILSL